MKKDRLGRGLGALLGEYATSEASAAEEGEVTRVATKDIVPNPLQPRQDFQEDELRELVDSIRENGLLQPLVVRPSPTAPGRFELVAGERRFSGRLSIPSRRPRGSRPWPNDSRSRRRRSPKPSAKTAPP
jgi:hypothetical protein